MKQKLIILISTLSLFALLFSCNVSEPREIVTNNKFKMQIPKFMRSQKNLNEEASMVYASGLRELYVMVLDEPAEQIEQVISENDLDGLIDTDLDGFSQLIGSNEGEYFLTPTDLDKLKNASINGLKARIFDNTRKINGINVYYKVALIEGKNTYYQVIAWTLAGREIKNGALIDNIINSFEEL
ncbi:MAG: hypothetical protein LBV72_10470 [Tannerella sp.]|jgi:hypothetical protein|nr:hypothetical protein [Tannerella sp.]